MNLTITQAGNSLQFLSEWCICLRFQSIIKRAPPRINHRNPSNPGKMVSTRAKIDEDRCHHEVMFVPQFGLILIPPSEAPNCPASLPSLSLPGKPETAILPQTDPGGPTPSTSSTSSPLSSSMATLAQCRYISSTNALDRGSGYGSKGKHAFNSVVMLSGMSKTGGFGFD